MIIRCLLPPFPNFPACPTLCSPCALPKRLFMGCSWVVYCLPSQNARPCALPKRFIACLFVVCCLPFPECPTLCTPETVYCLLIGCLWPPLPRLPSMPDLVLTLCTPKTVVIGCLWPPLPRMLDLVHSQNGLLLVYSLFIDYLLPPFPECSTLCTPKTVYCLFIRCLLIICCLPSQTSQNARPCALPKRFIASLFIDYLLPPFPNFTECPTLCSPCVHAY